MKTKIYFLTLAASVAFAACTDDELESMNNADLQKAELVALDGIQATVSMNTGVDSRIANGQWEATDEVGVGFTNWLTGDEGTFVGNGYDDGDLKNTEDGTLYANHRLFRTEGTWKFENVVYEGLHYAYYPLDAKHTAVKPLTAKVGTEQVYGEEADFEANGIFAISSMYDLQEDQAGKAPVVNFALNTISNRLKLNLEVADFAGITDPIIVKSVGVREISSTPVKAFAQTATVVNVPMVVYTERNELDDDSTAEEIETAEEADAEDTAKAFELAFATPSGDALTYVAAEAMGTTVKGHTGFTTSAKTYAVNIFSFPIKEKPVALAIDVVTNYGTVTVVTMDEESDEFNELSAASQAVVEANNKALDAILTVLRSEHEKVDFADREQAASAIIKLDLKANEPVLSEISVASADEWAAAISIASQVEEVSTINVTKDLAVSLTNLPANVTEITIADGKTLTISGNVTTEDLTISPVASTGKVKVAASTALTVNGTIAAPANLEITTGVENWGDITVGENGFLTLSGETENHANVINKKSLTVETFINHKDELDEDNDDSHDCEGIVKNYATLTIEDLFTNQGTYYTIGANSGLTGMFTNTEGTAITEEGGLFTGINDGIKKATVSTPAEMALAINKATEITITGAVSLSDKVAEATKFILKDNAELYMLGNEVLAGDAAASSNLTIEVKGENTKISTKSAQYIFKITVKAGKDLTILKDSKLGVNKFNYEINSTVTNNGYGVLIETTADDSRGTWAGLVWNKYIDADGEEVILTGF